MKHVIRSRKPDYMGGRQQPLFTPETTWVQPKELPDLRHIKEWGIDTETNDKGLQAHRGPGWVYRNGYIAGIGIAWGQPGTEQTTYIPVSHPDTENFDRDNVKRWLKDHRHLRWVMQNGPYDLGWFSADFDIEPPEQIDDTTAMSVMLDEHQPEYNLDAIADRCDVPGKNEDLLKEAAQIFLRAKTKEEIKVGIYRLPARYVGEYGGDDALATLRSARVMRPMLQSDEVTDAYQLEMDLIPLIQAMRWKGIRVDLDRAEQAKIELIKRRDKAFEELSKLLGERVGMEEIGKTSWLQRVFDLYRISYPRTVPTKRFPEGQPSFTAGSTGWMHKHPHWLPRLIVNADRYNNAAEKYVQGFIIDYAHRGRIHASINQFLSEEPTGGRRGAKTFRFSYSDPALQQMPSRDPEIMNFIRGCFVPDKNELWGRVDYEQQEYRLIVHFAARLKLKGAAEAVRRYRDDPNTDFHNYVVSLTNLDRTSAKNLNFAKVYGASIPKIASMMNSSETEAERVNTIYDKELPFVSELADECKKLAGKRGWIKLIDGARIHYPFWEGPWMSYEERAKFLKIGTPLNPCRLEEAERRQADSDHPWHGKRLRRADVKDAMNGLIQGSAARQVKIAMRNCWREKIIPNLQVHDELNGSFSNKEDAERMAEIMRDAIKLEVPMGAECEFGVSWARAKANKSLGYKATWKEAWTELMVQK